MANGRPLSRYEIARLRLEAFKIISDQGWGTITPSTDTSKPASHKKWNWDETVAKAKELAEKMASE